MPDLINQTGASLATPKLDELDDARATVERLAAANQALTQRLDREHSMRLAAEADRDQWKSAAMMHTAGKVSAWSERDESERRAHEAEAALEVLRADVERDRIGLASPANAASPSFDALAVASVCELLAAWGRLMDRNDARGAIAEARAAALLDAKDAASGAIGSLAWGTR